MDQAVLFADRLGAELAPLTERTSVALLPVAGKPMIEHALESLAKAGIRRILVVVSPFADEIQRVIGDGTRWGLRLTYTLTRGEEDPTAVVDRLGTRLDGSIVALRGDLILGFDVPAWISVARTTPGDAVWADADGVSAACGIHREGAIDLTPLAWPPTDRAAAAQQTAWIPVAAEQVRTVPSLAEYHRVNLDAAAKRLPGLILPGRQAALGLTLGRGSRVSPRSLKQGVCLVGARCRIAPDAELTGEVVISDDVIVDRRATINSSVILPHTYVGELPESRVSLVIPRGGILLPRGLGPWRRPFVPGFALRSQPCPTPRWSAGHDSALKWLDGVWDALCILPPRLRDSRPFATAATRSRPRLPGTTRLRFALHGAQRLILKY
jgi:hypothetical protein